MESGRWCLTQAKRGGDSVESGVRGRRWIISTRVLPPVLVLSDGWDRPKQGEPRDAGTLLLQVLLTCSLALSQRDEAD